MRFDTMVTPLLFGVTIMNNAIYGQKSVSTTAQQQIEAALREARPDVAFYNESDNVFTDISSEASRTYNFGSRGFVKIENPAKLSVSDSGGHRVFSRDGKSHYIPTGWIQLSWTVHPGHANFVK
jgi:hypothetical protein